jgi:DNA-binding transcriptional MocR family regulator
VFESETISLARGAPSLDIVDVAGLQAAASRALENDPAGAFSYGTAAGYTPLREWIAAHHAVETERVIVTNGSLQADTFIFDLTVSAGDVVVVEAPTYDRTLSYLQDRGAKVLAIPLESDGICVDRLESALADGARPKLCHIIPNFHNPAGCTLSVQKRRRLLELASEYDFLIFEDDPYIELRFEGDKLPTMLSMDTGDRVVYASSFSKTVCPGIRVGYLVGPQAVIQAATRLAQKAYISPNMVAQAIVSEFARSGELSASVAAVISALRDRRDALVKALRTRLSEVSFVIPEGGYFLWASLPETVDCQELDAAAKKRGVTFVKGSDFFVAGGDHYVRFAYSAAQPGQITEAIDRIASAYESLEKAHI